MRVRRPSLYAAGAGLALVAGIAMRPTAPGGPGIDAIKVADVTRDLTTMASDAMRGREGGTLDEMRASVWLADQIRAAGLQPGGNDGSYYQWLPMRRYRESNASKIIIGSTQLNLFKDVSVIAPVDGSFDAPLVYVAPGGNADAATVKGKIVATSVVTPPPAPPSNNPNQRRGAPGGANGIRQAATRFLDAGALAVLVVADSASDAGYDRAQDAIVRGRFGVDTASGVAYWPDPSSTPYRPQSPAILWLRSRYADLVKNSTHATLHLSTENFTYPSVNMIGRIRGTDPKLRDEVLVYSAHTDHDGVRTAIDGDSIWNGADDNASGAVAILAVARAMVKAPPKRSVLFIWHGSEERGLIGSRYFVQHPTVPLHSIVAVLNAEMVGRNNPDTMTILGQQPPHRNSTTLVDDAVAANSAVTHFKLDTLWDKASHPQGWYFRSDHLPYARLNIPAIAYTSDLHADYHTPRDESSRIDMAKVTRVAKWMYATGWTVANAAQRPAVDAGFKLEK
ncbi:MAG TPA: M28 family peptidase [Gemmatimonadaceae bacterium]|jgi:hypothetical protein